MRTLRLILGDQLNPLHPWLDDVSDDVTYVMMEVRQETDYVLHHAQKILAIFAAMRDFARQLRQRGHRIHYLAIDDRTNQQSIPANLDALLREHAAQRFEFQAPDEWRLDQQLDDYADQLKIDAAKVDSHHFYTTRGEAADFFGKRKHWLMESFYRHMRRKHAILLEHNGQPTGGRWNYDHANRHAWHGAPPEPEDIRPTHDHRRLWETITASGVKSFGEPRAAAFLWPLNRDEALAQLDAFIAHVLADFGNFQDAMNHTSPRLFHSLLSFALNTKMLSPREVVERVEEAWRNGDAPLAAAEGFIRQILGWREYVRGVYWSHMPGYGDKNVFGHTRELPAWFWHGKTRMRCMQHAIGQSLNEAHAHHIQRLMVIGNFALLAGLVPEQVHQWYLGVYVDAFEWVEMPNTLGMSQFADGGLLATKPYVSSAAYIHRMSDYCQGCFYKYKERTGPRACPYNALYWDFFLRNKTALQNNPRVGIAYQQLARMSPAVRRSLRARAAELLDDLDNV